MPTPPSPLTAPADPPQLNPTPLSDNLAGAPRQREIRLDFFRGLAMFIIFISHMPGNPWARYIPARFGTSDATEMFVFCSGFASAIAFGGVFARRGFGLGLARIIHRCWQIYWVHICLFFAIASASVIGHHLIGPKDYIAGLNLWHFFDDPVRGIPHLLTLTYVPNYFDILPMYFGVLLMLPLVIALRRIGVWAVLMFSVGLWAFNLAFDIQLPAEWWSDREWFFDPFGWQLIFFAGFGFGAGWYRPPPISNWLAFLAIVVVMGLMVVSYYPLWSMVPEFAARESIELAWEWGKQKTDFGPLRPLHFAALAYLAYCVFSNGREERLRGRWSVPIIDVGQQALATFAASMFLSIIVSMGLDVVGRTGWTVAIANLWGFAVLILVARVTGFFKSSPWRARK